MCPGYQRQGAQAMDQGLIFAICMFLGVVAVGMIAFSLLWIALGKLSV